MIGTKLGTTGSTEIAIEKKRKKQKKKRDEMTACKNHTKL
jgi:hypothetical protein